MKTEPTISEILAEQAAWRALSDDEQIAIREKQLGIRSKNRIHTKKKSTQWKHYTKKQWEETRQKVFEQHGKVCYICSGIANQVDHVLPKSKYPELALSLENLRPICWPCNSKKAAKVSI